MLLLRTLNELLDLPGAGSLGLLVGGLVRLGGGLLLLLWCWLAAATSTEHSS